MNDPQNEPRTCPYCDQPRQDTFENRFRFECGTSLRSEDHKTVKQGDACRLRVELRAAQAEVERLREAIQSALEIDRTIPRNGTDEVHSNQPQGWMPPGKRRKIIDSLSAALDKKEGQP